MPYDESFKFDRAYHLDELACPRCGRETTVTLIVPRTGRARWCKHCKVLYDKLGVIHDVLAWHETEWLNEQE